MKVVFLAPNYPPEMQQYTRGLAEVGALRLPGFPFLFRNPAFIVNGRIAE